MNNYRKKNFRGKRGYSRSHRRSSDSYHQPLPPDQETIPYARHTLTKQDVESVVDALLSGTLTCGRELERFESLLGKLTHSDHAIALSSGTAALHAALACLGLKPEDEVITCTLNFSGIANMITLVGAKMVLVDCEPNTLTIGVQAVRDAITSNTKAIFANNFAGHAPDMTLLREICDEHNLILLEDACHGLGGRYRGHYVGNQADITCFSFHPSKAITTCEGGAVTTNNKEWAAWIRQFRHHGIQKDSRHFKQWKSGSPAFYQEVQFQGMNYRMSDIHAALGRSQLTRLDRHIERRRAVAQTYYNKFRGIDELSLPYVASWADSAFHLFPIRLVGDLTAKRDSVFNELRANNLEVQVHYIPIHMMPLYKDSVPAGSMFPNAEAYFQSCISLPIFPDLSYKDLERITDVVIKAVKKFSDGTGKSPSRTEAAPNNDDDDDDDSHEDGEERSHFGGRLRTVPKNEHVDEDSDDDADDFEDNSDDEDSENSTGTRPKRGGRRRSNRRPASSKEADTDEEKDLSKGSSRGGARTSSKETDSESEASQKPEKRTRRRTTRPSSADKADSDDGSETTEKPKRTRSTRPTSKTGRTRRTTKSKETADADSGDGSDA